MWWIACRTSSSTWIKQRMQNLVRWRSSSTNISGESVGMTDLEFCSLSGFVRTPWLSGCPMSASVDGHAEQKNFSGLSKGILLGSRPSETREAKYERLLAPQKSKMPLSLQTAANEDARALMIMGNPLLGFQKPLLPEMARALAEIRVKETVGTPTAQYLPTLDDHVLDIVDSPTDIPGILQCKTKRTFQPSLLVRKRRHGFLSRMSSSGGKRVLARRRRKGRCKISA